MPVVLDASVALAWCFEDEAAPYADRVQDMLERDGALVPAIWPLEVANALCVGERKQRLRPADVVRATELLCALPIMVDNSILPREFGPVLALARTYGLSSYDASYVELAMRAGLPFATQDARLRAVATDVGVPLVP